MEEVQMFVQTKQLLYEDKPNHDSAARLWEGVRKGNKETLSRLYCCFYSMLFNYGLSIVPRESFTKDCIQELFLVLWNKRDTVNRARSVRSYLYSSLRRIMFRKLAKQRNRSDRNQVYVNNFNENPINIEDLIIQFETQRSKKQQLSKAINDLSSRQKEALLLKYYNGLSSSEIASIMQINKQSVYNHVSNAIAQLQEILGA